MRRGNRPCRLPRVVARSLRCVQVALMIAETFSGAPMRRLIVLGLVADLVRTVGDSDSIFVDITIGLHEGYEG